VRKEHPTLVVEGGTILSQTEGARVAPSRNFMLSSLRVHIHPTLVQATDLGSLLRPDRTP
jgi:hypothetical protein